MINYNVPLYTDPCPCAMRCKLYIMNNYHNIPSITDIFDLFSGPCDISYCMSFKQLKQN